MTIRIFQLPPKAGEVTNLTKLPTEDINDETNKTRMVSASDLTPSTWAATDEDSPLSTGVLYTTEAGTVGRTLGNAFASLKNAPTGNTIFVDIEKETTPNSNVFATILSTLISITVGQFTSTTSADSDLNTTQWESGRRLRIVLITNDANFAATGLKVTIKS